MGYRHFDSAMFYGSEQAVGLALSKGMKKNNLRRDEFFITSKVIIDYMLRKIIFNSFGVTNMHLRMFVRPVNSHLKTLDWTIWIFI